MLPPSWNTYAWLVPPCVSLRCDSVSNYQPHDCLLNRVFRRRSKKTSNLRVTGLCAGNSPGTGEFPAQMASKAENVSIWWRHHVLCSSRRQCPTWPRAHSEEFDPAVNELWMGLWCFTLSRYGEKSMNKCVAKPQALKWKNKDDFNA